MTTLYRGRTRELQKNRSREGRFFCMLDNCLMAANRSQARAVIGEMRQTPLFSARKLFNGGRIVRKRERPSVKCGKRRFVVCGNR